PEVMSHSSFFYTPRCRPCSTLFPTRRSSDLAGHADVDRATLIGDELFRATDLDGNTAHGIDEVAGGFAQNAHLFALHVGRSANGLLLGKQLDGAVILPPHDAGARLADHFVDFLTDGAFGGRGPGQYFVAGEQERHGENAGGRNGACVLVNQHQAHVDGTCGDCLRNFASLVQLGGVVDFDLDLLVRNFFYFFLEVDDIRANGMFGTDLNAYLEGAFGIGGHGTHQHE